ncbi:MAG TPA: SAM-dependent methyltransferase [Gaiellaceae bacterium]
MGAGSLTVVGTGIQLVSQVTPQTRAAIERADEVLYVVTDPLTAVWIERLNANARSLDRHYEPGRDRAETYAAIVEETLAAVRAGRRVCLAFYGHPGVFVDPGHEAVKRAREEGFRARMLPAVSAEDCLVSDLGLDPGELGCQSYEATAFLVYRYRVEPAALLVLWQIGFLGQVATTADPVPLPLDVLVERLSEHYPDEHDVVVYEAAVYPILEPHVERLPLAALPAAEVPPMATLVVPPAARAPVDEAMIDRLGLPRR